MSVSRRRFLGLAGGAGLVGASASLGFVRLGPAPQTGTLLRSRVPLPAPFGVPLPIPPVARPRRAGGTDVYELTARPADVEILPGHRTRVWGYDGVFPGPTIVARSGRPARVRVVNALPVATNVHLHGGRTPAASDGYPTDLILPASGGHAGHTAMAGEVTMGAREYVYPLEQRAATLWYHDHTMDFTGPNVYRGLAGFLLVGDDADDRLPLPRGERDLPLMLTDRAFDADGSLRYPALDPSGRMPGVTEPFMAGVLGDVVLVNGAPWPFHEVDRARYRLRVLNASNARRYELALDPLGAFTQIGTDGGLLAAPVRRDTVTLAPAERADLVVDFAAWPAGTRVRVVNRLGSGTTAPVLAFEVARDARDDTAVPARLAEVERLDRAAAVRTRTFRFQLRRERGPGPGTDDSGAGHLRWMVNGRTFDPGHDEATPRLGDVEVWRFMTDLHHPVHLHLAHFQVLARNGRAPRPGDQGWKDTIDLIPGQTAEVIARFDGYRGRYVLHCHNLEHEDMAMMANFQVT